MHFDCTLPIAKCMVYVSVLQCFSDCSCTLCTEHLLLHTACTHAYSVYAVHAVCMQCMQSVCTLRTVLLSSRTLHCPLISGLITPYSTHHSTPSRVKITFTSLLLFSKFLCGLTLIFTCCEFTYSSCEGHVKVIVILLCVYPVCKLQNPKSCA